MTNLKKENEAEIETCEFCSVPIDRECKESCGCQDCVEDREAEKDREFDEKVALGYL